MYDLTLQLFLFLRPSVELCRQYVMPDHNLQWARQCNTMFYTVCNTLEDNVLCRINMQFSLQCIALDWNVFQCNTLDDNLLCRINIQRTTARSGGISIQCTLHFNTTRVCSVHYISIHFAQCGLHFNTFHTVWFSLCSTIHQQTPRGRKVEH